MLFIYPPPDCTPNFREFGCRVASIDNDEIIFGHDGTPHVFKIAAPTGLSKKGCVRSNDHFILNKVRYYDPVREQVPPPTDNVLPALTPVEFEIQKIADEIRNICALDGAVENVDYIHRTGDAPYCEQACRDDIYCRAFNSDYENACRLWYSVPNKLLAGNGLCKMKTNFFSNGYAAYNPDTSNAVPATSTTTATVPSSPAPITTTTTTTSNAAVPVPTMTTETFTVVDWNGRCASGTEGIDYFETAAEEEGTENCEVTCGNDASCVAYHSDHYNKCYLWVTMPTSSIVDNVHICKVKDSVAPNPITTTTTTTTVAVPTPPATPATFTILGWGHCATGTEGIDYFETVGVDEEGDAMCEATCANDSTCLGFETDYWNLCYLWVNPPTSSTGSGSKCKVKDVARRRRSVHQHSSSSLLSFQAIAK
eukprot:Awhi_evm1s14912